MKYPQLVSMPSAVSDWLEEQLDARGIDAVVYTRYVLSLLQHHHSQDEDLGELEQEYRQEQQQQQQQHAKESTAGGKHPSGRGSGGGANKRLRRSWFQHVVRVADVEQLRRSAAVEALMSAAEQKCGIESLVDELCEKLKHFESIDTTPESKQQQPPTSSSSSSNTPKTLSPADLARKYYAAFPPLIGDNNNTTTQSKLITLIPQICTTQTSKRKHNRRPVHHTQHSTHINHSNHLNYKEKAARVDMKSRSGTKQRLFLSKRDYGFARNMEKSDTSDWDMYFLNNRMGDEGYSTSDTTEEDTSTAGKKIDEAHLAKLVAKFDQKIEALWNVEENDYADLPFDIQELLASPIKNVEIYGNKHVQTGGAASKSFIQCGTNITSSIWTDGAEENEQSLYDTMSFSYLYGDDDSKVLGDQFNSLSVAAADDNTYKFGDNFTSLPWEIFPSNFNNNKKWSDAEEKRNNNVVVNRAVNDSLATLNHFEASCFKEVVPKQASALTSYEILEQKIDDDLQQEETKVDEEDLLTSTRTHFRPIKQDSHHEQTLAHHYADGTTFAIRSSLEHINYRRSDSGTLYLESGFDTPKKYQEYRVCDAAAAADDTELDREFVLKFCVRQNEKCCQTDIDDTESDADADADVDDDDVVESGSSQSHSPLEVPAKKRVLCDPEEFFFPGDEELLSDTVDAGAECSCASRGRVKLATNLEPLFNASTEACSLHGRDSTVAEINWPEGGSTSWRKCDKCNNNWSTQVWPKPDPNHLNPANTTSVWGSGGGSGSGGTSLVAAEKPDGGGGGASWQQIWSSSEELCRTCLGVPAGSGPPPGRSLEYFKLREELSEDGEQLLSDLSCLQRVYMEQLPAQEITCDLNTLPAVATATATIPSTATIDAAPAAPASTTKLFGIIGERKRRHSSSQRSCEPIAATVARNSWTNSSCLQLRCLFTPPLLRPVTL